MPDTFDAIYRQNLWHGEESRSGPGSGRAATSLLVELLPVIALELGASSVLDIGCGDGFWMPDLPGYIGADVSAQAVRLAKRRHRRRHYLVADYRVEVPPAVDLVILRDVLQHLSHASGVALLRNIEASGSGWLLASSYDTGIPNVDIPDGGSATPSLLSPPYSLPPSERLYPDGFHYHPGEPTTRDPYKYLGLWQLGALWPIP